MTCSRRSLAWREFADCSGRWHALLAFGVKIFSCTYNPRLRRPCFSGVGKCSTGQTRSLERHRRAKTGLEGLFGAVFMGDEGADCMALSSLSRRKPLLRIAPGSSAGHRANCDASTLGSRLRGKARFRPAPSPPYGTRRSLDPAPSPPLLSRRCAESPCGPGPFLGKRAESPCSSRQKGGLGALVAKKSGTRRGVRPGRGLGAGCAREGGSARGAAGRVTRGRSRPLGSRARGRGRQPEGPRPRDRARARSGGCAPRARRPSSPPQSAARAAR